MPFPFLLCFARAVRFARRFLAYGAVAGGCMLMPVSALIVSDWPLEVYIYMGETEDEDELERTRMLGPIYEKTNTRPVRYTAVRPVAVEFFDDHRESWEVFIAYPYFRFQQDPYRKKWSLFSIIESEHGVRNKDRPYERFRVFPFIFYQETGDPATSYSGVFPFAGSIKQFLIWQEFSWTFFPLFAEFSRGGVKRHYVAWPFISWLSGPGAEGFSVWPLAGDLRVENRYEYRYFLWPLIYSRIDQFDQERPRERYGFLPFYAREESVNVMDETYFYPFFGYRTEYEPRYDEVRYFWPFLVQGRGYKYINRWAPFYSHSLVHGRDKTWFMWPFVKLETWQEKGLRMEQQRFLYFLWRRQAQYSLDNPALEPVEKISLLPLGTYWSNGAGKKQFQLFSPLEPIYQNNKVIRAVYSPLFAIYRWEQVEPGHQRYSVIYDMLTVENHGERRHWQFMGPLLEETVQPEFREMRLLRGLLGMAERPDGRTLSLFWQDIELGPAAVNHTTPNPRRSRAWLGKP
jgi:hypothetical protein